MNSSFGMLEPGAPGAKYLDPLQTAVEANITITGDEGISGISETHPAQGVCIQKS